MVPLTLFLNIPVTILFSCYNVEECFNGSESVIIEIVFLLTAPDDLVIESPVKPDLP